MKISPKLKRLAWPVKILVVAIWLISVGIFLHQILIWSPPQPKPYSAWTSLLGLFSAAFVWLLKSLKDVCDELEEEKFSAPKALALGYLNNFVKPALNFLLQPQNITGADLRFYIFLPEKLADLDDLEINFARANLISRGFVVGSQTIVLANGQMRAVETISRGGKTVYLDFPKTARVLNDVVNLKVSSTDLSAQEKFGKNLVERFNEIVETEIRKSDSFLSRHVKTIRKDFDFKDAPEGF